MSDKTLVPELVDVTTAVLSNVREKILEHRLVSDLAEVMVRRGVEMDVMRSEFDAHGHDVVLEAAGVIRHVQLKAMVAAANGATSTSTFDCDQDCRAAWSGCCMIR